MKPRATTPFCSLEATPDDPRFFQRLISRAEAWCDGSSPCLYRRRSASPERLMRGESSVIEARAGMCRKAVGLWQDAFKRAPHRGSIGMNIARVIVRQERRRSDSLRSASAASSVPIEVKRKNAPGLEGPSDLSPLDRRRRSCARATCCTTPYAKEASDLGTLRRWPTNFIQLDTCRQTGLVAARGPQNGFPEFRLSGDAPSSGALTSQGVNRIIGLYFVRTGMMITELDDHPDVRLPMGGVASSSNSITSM